ncbi:hypothetical protein C0995_006265 [Termitomyces sp. Mi166|nr:hypothetical protein C0995_006265 [Termitomyces sp. Mi166\
MADNMSYSSSAPYLPNHAQYYSPLNHGHTHLVSPPSRPEPTQRKRPKYTRSKTGCMTCRVKKIKCDETKPNCMRCTHGQRDCTWPEGAPTRKKSVAKKDPVDGRPSTAGSSGLSEASTPPTREHTPPRRSNTDVSAVPLSSSRRGTSEPYALHPIPTESDSVRRLPINHERSGSTGYSHHSTNSSNGLNMIPESTYTASSRYDTYSHSSHSSRHSGFRPLNHEPMGWSHTHSDYVG